MFRSPESLKLLLSRSLPTSIAPSPFLGFRRAAVLIPVVFRNGEARIVFTRRTMTVATHKGQVAFPGGGAEPEDASDVATALREAHEEIGLHPRQVEVVGTLLEQVTSSGFVVTPVVGIVDPSAAFVADPVEVAEIFELSLDALRAPETYAVEEIPDGERTYVGGAYRVDGYLVWGLSARILDSFLKLLSR